MFIARGFSYYTERMRENIEYNKKIYCSIRTKSLRGGQSVFKKKKNI